MSAEDKLTNPVRQRMQAGGVSLGMPVRLGRSGDIARGCRRAAAATTCFAVTSSFSLILASSVFRSASAAG